MADDEKDFAGIEGACRGTRRCWKYMNAGGVTYGPVGPYDCPGCPDCKLDHQKEVVNPPSTEETRNITIREVANQLEERAEELETFAGRLSPASVNPKKEALRAAKELRSQATRIREGANDA